MKKIVLSLSVLFTAATHAQTFVANDSVVSGAGYANQVFYTLSNGTKAPAALAEWDLAFQVDLMQAGIHVNHPLGISVFKSPVAGNAQNFAAFDSTGYSNWQNLTNSVETWNTGAFNADRDPNVAFDYGWGDYNFQQNSVFGDKMYLIRKTNQGVPTTFYKFLPIAKTAQNQYIFTFSKLDNTGSVTDTIECSNLLVGKNFLYYNLANAQSLDREPQINTWDLLFTRYSTFVTQGPNTAFTNVAGVFSAPQVNVCQLTGQPESSTIDVPSLVYSGNLSEIGYDWKSFTPPGGPWVIDANVSYVVQVIGTETKFYYLVFTGFSGSSTGTYRFYKEDITPTSINENSSIELVKLFPNPSNGSTTLAYSLKNNVENLNYTITSLDGKVITTQILENKVGLNSISINNTLPAGVYFVNILGNGIAKTLKLMVN